MHDHQPLAVLACGRLARDKSRLTGDMLAAHGLVDWRKLGIAHTVLDGQRDHLDNVFGRNCSPRPCWCSIILD